MPIEASSPSASRMGGSADAELHRQLFLDEPVPAADFAAEDRAEDLADELSAESAAWDGFEHVLGHV
jgi:hypothetical protein